MKNSLLIILVLFFTGCTTQKATESNQETEMSMENQNTNGSSLVQPKDPLLGKWQLKYLSPTSGRDISHYKIQKPYLNFVDEHKVAGNNGCNNIAGAYIADESKINFETSKFASTRMFCEGVDEAAFLTALGTANRYTVMEDGLKLNLLTDDVVILSFTKVIEKVDIEK